ncbi:MAG TPA: hypothetical protein VFS20_07695 [Longimicrobium sp.]|nr:hypothetical protein [Longimicrobium sp.]
MIRFDRLVLMLAFALAQAAAVECPMGPAEHEHAPAPAHQHADAHAGGHAHGAHAPAHRHDHAPDHGPAACALVMACGTAAVASGEIAVPRLVLSPAAAPVRAAGLYASPYIPIDAPPPRPSVAA